MSPEEKKLNEFLRETVYRSNVIAPTVPYMKGHLMDGSRELGIEEEQQRDAIVFRAVLKHYLIRPEYRTPNVGALRKGNTVPFRSSLIRVFLDLLRGTRKASIYDYHCATRMSFPVKVVDGKAIHAHMEVLPWNIKDKRTGEVKDPRIYNRIETRESHNKVDSRYVLTIRWPDLPFLKDIFQDSEYPPGKIDGAMYWDYFCEHDFFYEMIRSLKTEVRNEDLDEHPALFFSESFFDRLNGNLKKNPWNTGTNFSLFSQVNF
jgi:hypothetical protein